MITPSRTSTVGPWGTPADDEFWNATNFKRPFFRSQVYGLRRIQRRWRCSLPHWPGSAHGALTAVGGRTENDPTSETSGGMTVL